MRRQGTASAVAFKRAALKGAVALALAGLAACGGGGSGGSGETGANDARTPSADGLASGQYRNEFSNQCAADNPFAFDASGASLAPPGVTYQKVSREQEQRFVRTMMDEVYLWRDKVPAVNPAYPAFRELAYLDGMRFYLQALTSRERLPNGVLRDRFTELVPTRDWQQLFEAESSLGYGILILPMPGAAAPKAMVGLVEEGSPAARQGVRRGEELVSVKTPAGEEITIAGLTPQGDARLKRLLFQPARGEQLTLRLKASETAPVREVPLAVASYPKRLVNHRTVTATDGAKVGYLSLLAFQPPGEGQMQKAMEQLSKDGVQDLVVDLRYNMGGELGQAAQLAHMVADAGRTAGKVFERVRFNDRIMAQRNGATDDVPFVSQASGRPGTGTTAGAALPSLGLKRVMVLTGAQSCSASEAFINGLRGVDVEVVQIGGQTCGKPYAFSPISNCGVTYNVMMGLIENGKGNADYEAGMVPTCRVDEDFRHSLGNPDERLFAAALQYRRQGACPTGTSTRSLGPDRGGQRQPAPWLQPPLNPFDGLLRPADVVPGEQTDSQR